MNSPNNEKCLNYQLDMAGEFGACKCGAAKSDHPPEAFNSTRRKSTTTSFAEAMQKRRQSTTTPGAPSVKQPNAEAVASAETKSPGPKQSSSKNSGSPGSSHSMSLRRPSIQRSDKIMPLLEMVQPEDSKSSDLVLTAGEKAMEELKHDKNKDKTVNAVMIFGVLGKTKTFFSY
jgi:hypothetical protein